MSATARIGDATESWLSSRRQPSIASRMLTRWLTGALAVIALFLAAGALGLGLYASAHADRIYEGVTIGRVPVGGLSRDAARAKIEADFARYAESPLTLTAGEQTFPLTPAAAGARLDSDASVAAAFDVGRGGSLWARSRTWARDLLHGSRVEPLVTVDPVTAEQQLRTIAPEIVRAPVDASIAMTAEAQPALIADVPGVAFSLGATQARLINQITRLDSSPIAVVVRESPAAVPASALAPRLDRARAAVSGALVLSTTEGIWHVPARDLTRIVAVDPTTTDLRVDRQSLETLVAGLAAEIDRPAVDAAITVDANGYLAPVAGQAMAAVDVAATVAAIDSALRAGQHDVGFVVNRAEPKITTAAATAAAAKGESLIDAGMELSWSGGRARLGRNDLLRALTIRGQPGATEPFAFGLDTTIVADLLAPVAAEFDQPAADARFRIIDGQIQVVSQAKTGRALDLEAGVKTVLATFGKPDPSAKLTVETLKPKHTAADLSRITLGDDILAEASTYYGDSSEPRRLNVERASVLESGWLIPPDGVFSYVENVGDVDEANGFVTGYGIIADEGGGVTTAPVIGGGICQVSTTIFQAAFWAGLPIEERYQHPYYLRSYGEAPRGLPGLDAMVNIEEDWSLDLKVRNTTGEWLALVMIADGQNIYARLVGTNPGWDVQVSEPKITNFVPKASKMHYTQSSELPAGQELLVESAEDGFDVSIERTVSDGNRVIDQYAVSSSFAPAKNTTLRGTGSATSG